MSKVYADIIINISHEALDKVFQYEVPFVLFKAIRVGMAVYVPFGRGNKEKLGYVVGFSQIPNYDVTKIKSILRIAGEEVPIEGKMIRLAGWIRNNYGCTMIQALKTVIPASQKIQQKQSKEIGLLADKKTAELFLEEAKKKNRKAQVRLLEELLGQMSISWDLAVKQLKIPRTTIAKLEQEKILFVKTTKEYRNPITFSVDPEPAKLLNKEQQSLVDEFSYDYERKNYRTYLLHGVTGSGKTEVYLAAIEKVVKQGKQAIVLIPEIALTYQTVKRFYQRFGERVSIMNSRLSQGERYDQMQRAKHGDIDIMIGPRSALFTPFPHLGLIVIDEEHEGSYKSETVPKYHARETAIARAKMEGASVILGSATPSVESYQKALSGEYVLWQLSYRAVEGANMAEVSIVDLREELKEGNRSLFSRKLRKMMQQRLKNKEQIMLFLNRRGFSGFVSCRSCGEAIKCPHCDVSLTAHKDGKLVCHYCGYESPTPSLCPHCGSPYIGGFGVGTQKVEWMLQREFPGARILRMDMDTTRKKHSFEEILSAFSNGEADILIGTQMIVKGHDFANTTLVGILAADLSLHTNDFRASERTFQLLTQAAGRAGRGNLKGDVVIQTYQPKQYSVVCAAKQDYKAFYEQEIAYRRVLAYPPFFQMLVVFITSKEEQVAEHATKLLLVQMKELASSMEGIQVIGGQKASITKVKDVYRYVIYAKHRQYEQLVKMQKFLERYMEEEKIFKKAMVTFDFNPMIGY